MTLPAFPKISLGKRLVERVGLSRIFPGWWMVVSGGIIALWGHGYYTYGFSALFKPISAELGFGRAATSVPASIGRMEGGFEAPLAGWVVDRFGPRGIVLVGVAIAGLALVLMNFINSLWSFYVVWGVMLGTGTNLALGVPLDAGIANWFVRRRGLALSVKWALSGLSGVVVPPLITWLMFVHGWRTACVIGGVTMLAVGLPLVWFFLRRHRPEYYGLLPDGAKADRTAVDTGQMIERGVEYATRVQEVEFTLRQAMKTPAFWLILVAAGFQNLVGPALYIPHHTLSD
jgi:sugar phosphate permease